jgi:cell shape-determining protein MreD
MPVLVFVVIEIYYYYIDHPETAGQLTAVILGKIFSVLYIDIYLQVRKNVYL